MFSKEEKKGLFVAPLAGVVVFSVYLIFLFIEFPLGIAPFLIFVLISIPLSYAGMIIVGIPVILALRKSQDLTLIRLAIAGGFAGAFVHPIAAGLIMGEGLDFNYFTLLVGISEGMVVAVTYGVIAKVKLRDVAT